MNLRQIKKGLRVMRGRRPGKLNFLLAAVAAQLRLDVAIGKPVSITIEPANFCNLKCPACETGNGTLGRKPVMMPLDDYRRIMDKVAGGANHVMLYFMGETFLNPAAYDMIAESRARGLYVMTCTNGEYVDPERLYRSGINQISWQLGGTTQAAHEQYRRNGHLDKALETLRAYTRLIREGGRKKGEHSIAMGLIVMKHNVHQIDEFKALGAELGVDKVDIIAPCVRSAEQARELIPDDERFWIYEKKTFESSGKLVNIRETPVNTCPWLYFAITIQVDGTVVACCHDPLGRMPLGNMLTDSLESVWNGTKFRKLRHMVNRNQRDMKLCATCPGIGYPLLYPLDGGWPHPERSGSDAPE